MAGAVVKGKEEEAAGKGKRDRGGKAQRRQRCKEEKSMVRLRLLGGGEEAVQACAKRQCSSSHKKRCE